VKLHWATHRLIHCKTRAQAEYIKYELKKRLKECVLELHENKTKIVYCKDKLRKEEYPETSFDFLGYNFRPRLSYSKQKNEYFVNFTPAVSKTAIREMSQEIRRWKLSLRNSQELGDFSRMYNSVLNGWLQYYGKFYKSGMTVVFNQLNKMLIKWAKKKYKKFHRSKTRASKWLAKEARRRAALFVYWQLGIFPAAE
jgi:RNA-directed DNA polymerase